jgi:hypothetical protein
MLKRTLEISRTALGSSFVVLASSLTMGCGLEASDTSPGSDDALGSVSEALCTVTQLGGLVASASSVENASFPASAAVDGNAATRWSSAFADPQWLRVDLGQPRYVDNVVLSWEAASAADYVLQLSLDGATWTTVKTVTNAGAGSRTDSLTNLSAHQARYVRVSGTRRTTPYGYSLYELKVNGDQNANCATDTARSIGSNLEAESNDGGFGLQYEATTDAGGGQNAGWIDPGDYVEWKVSVPAAGSYALTTRSATVAPATAQVLVDGVSKGVINMTTTGGWQSWSSFASQAFDVTAGTHTLRVAFASASQNLNWVKLAPAARVQDEHEVGLWRLAAKSDLLTLTRDANGALAGAVYSGNEPQHVRLRYVATNQYEIAIESTKQCLLPSGSAVVLGACGNAGVAWTLDTLRARSEAQPALHRLRAANGTCLTPQGSAAPTLSTCSDASNWYVEPVGFDERVKAVEYELRALLIVKPTTASPSIQVNATIPADAVAAVQAAFKGDVANWFRRITDGRIRWTAESVVSPDAMTTFYLEGGNYLPIPENMQPDIARYVPRGKYDIVSVVYTTGQQPGGWGWGPGVNPMASYASWVSVNGTNPTAAEWSNGQPEPAQVFVHEPMHGLDGYFAGKGGVPLPDGWLHGAELNQYTNGQYGWLHWYRDYLLGTVIATDDTYRGYGPRAFRLPTIRQDALTH